MVEKIRGHPLYVSENLGYRKILCIIGGITIFRRKFFVSQCRKISWASFQFFRKFGVSKNFMHNRGITIFRRNFFVSQCRKISWASLICFRKFGVSKNFMHNRGITIFRRKFFVSQCRKISWASLQCFRKFEVSKTFMHNRGYHNFPSKIFCLTVPKNFRSGGSFSVSLISGTEKIWINGGGRGASRFSVEVFSSHCTETFHWKTLGCYFRKILPSKFFMHRRGGGHHGFVGTFCLTAPKRKAL